MNQTFQVRGSFVNGGLIGRDEDNETYRKPYDSEPTPRTELGTTNYKGEDGGL